MSILFGPFRQILTMSDIPVKGPLSDSRLDIRTDAGVLVDAGKIFEIGPYNELRPKASSLIETGGEQVLVPGLIDTHTHVCYAGERFADYAMKLSGATYEDILREGGGIRHTVRETRMATDDTLRSLTKARIDHAKRQGVTTLESKSGYGLDVETELRQLRIIRELGAIPTCLAAHVMPEGAADMTEYLKMLRLELFPKLKEAGVRRVDLFWDAVAFHGDAAVSYLEAAKLSGFDVTLHADQFSRGGTRIAARVGAVSADHLEVISNDDIDLLARSHTAATALPGACIGLGMPYPPARKLLDAGCSLVIASDWNPGSAPNGHLLMQASVLAMAQKLTSAETWAAMTVRAASVLGLSDRGSLEPGKRADMVAFPAADYRAILHAQGSMAPSAVWIAGESA